MRIMNNLTPYDPARPSLNFKGATVSDDITNDCTTVDVSTQTTLTASTAVNTPSVDAISGGPLALGATANSVTVGAAATPTVISGTLTENGIIGVKLGTNIASATTIAPTQMIHHVTGTTAVVNITPPALFAAGIGGQITLIPDGAWSTTNAGNIAIATTAVVSKALIMTYDSGTGKWYPSY